MLSDHKDSTDSGSRIALLKMRAMEGLKKTIEYYDMRRRTLKSDFMKPDSKIDKDTILEDIDKFNARVEKRVQQIIDLAKTMQGYKDVDKWTNEGAGGGYWGGHYVVRNPDYYHNKSQTSKTDRTQKSITEELQDSVKSLKMTEGQLERALDGEITQQFRDLLEGELKRVRGLIRTREEQMQAIVTADANPRAKEIGTKQARNIEDLMNDMSEDLKRDFFTMFRHYDDLNREREQLKGLHAQHDFYVAELDKLQ